MTCHSGPPYARRVLHFFMVPALLGLAWTLSQRSVAQATSAEHIELVSLSSATFTVSGEEATTANYAASASGVLFNGTYALGDTLGGTFATQDWSNPSYTGFGVVVSLTGTDPNLPFSVSFYDPSFNIINTYSGTTTGATTSTYLPLSLVLSGTGDLSRVAGIQFTWDGGGSIACTVEKIATLAAPSPPVISSAPNATGRVGQPFSYRITASGSPSTFGATNLPVGVSVNAGNGVISGVPTAAGSFSVAISASSPGRGTGSAQLALSIAKGSQTINFKPAAVQRFQKGRKFTLSATATSRLAVTFRSSNPKILSISGRTATIRGKGRVTITASQGGNANFLPAATLQRTITIR